ncbi:uncharacterized protein LACBIDRAFT_306674 [Laccaria bicolor S238N-H82]|uniref:Predicted protein n=1 Tax=Laccaria bicolor (strain S238N-H82 / ATCC MYA-4686) TaxID=486041 RepID=B0DNJ0_LACBS|nr:uncharacterized protein LACBIDRAFT_306674 [Laccaria bicolor S238N-H82]EDR03949.1 predicted protein [Laccaria bicolor S238N-H82]|eukprot:XP_001885517.1 predicted protein [Laccaria bicolor S238N-H82]
MLGLRDKHSTHRSLPLFSSSHQFLHPTAKEPRPLQVGVTTNGEECRLASRITREVVARLPTDVGCAMQSVGRMRRFASSKAMDDTDPDEVSTRTVMSSLPTAR